MNFDDQDWELGQPPGEESRGISSTWKVGAGFALGLVLGGVLMHLLDGHLVQEAARQEAGATIERLQRSGGPSAAGTPAVPLPLAIDRLGAPLSGPGAKATETAPMVPPPNPSAVVDGETGSSAAVALRSVRQATERKAREWARFYKKPPQCDDNPNKEVMIECANHYIRTRRQFDEAYGAVKGTAAP